MAKLAIKAGATSVSVGLFIQDSSSTTGAGLTGIAFNSSGLTCYAVVPGSSAAAVTLATLVAANSAWSSGGFKEIDSTNMPGWYRFDIPNTNISTGRSVGFHFKGVTNMAPLPLEIALTGWDDQDAVRGGLTALPNAAAEAAGGLYTRGSGAGQINQAANGQVDTNTVKFGGTSGTFASGRPEVDLNSSATTELTSVPSSTAILKNQLQWLFLLARNKVTQTATTQIVKANDGSTTVGTSTVSDDTTTATRGAFS